MASEDAGMPIHLLLRWSADGLKNGVPMTETIDRHLQVAEEQGSVWWGKFHNNHPRNAMSMENLKRLRSQVDAGTETHAYLYRQGDAWRATLLELTDEAAHVDRDRLPDYYTAAECHLFARLSDFVQLTPEWPSERLMLASNPISGGMAGSLRGQAGVMFVLESDEVARESVEPRPISAVAKPPVEKVAVEAQHVEEYEVFQQPGAKTAKRTEQNLVLAFTKHLEAKGHEVGRHRYPMSLVCDLFDETEGVLIEAKGSASREAIRMAIGQLLDYRRFEETQPELAVLLPARPSSDLEELLSSVGVAVIWRVSEGQFDSIPG